MLKDPVTIKSSPTPSPESSPAPKIGKIKLLFISKKIVALGRRVRCVLGLNSTN